MWLPPERFDADQFAESGPAADMEPGPMLATIMDVAVGQDGSGLAGLSYDQLIGVVAAARRMQSRFTWYEMAAMREFAARAAELSIGRQQAEGIEASAERGYRPEVTLICREDLIGVVTIGEDGVQRICYADLKVAVLSSQASCSAQVIDIKVGNLVSAAGQVVDDREFLINANSVEHHVIDLREYERRDHGWLGDRAQDVLYHL